MDVIFELFHHLIFKKIFDLLINDLYSVCAVFEYITHFVKVRSLGLTTKILITVQAIYFV